MSQRTMLNFCLSGDLAGHNNELCACYLDFTVAERVTKGCGNKGRDAGPKSCFTCNHSFQAPGKNLLGNVCQIKIYLSIDIIFDL